MLKLMVFPSHLKPSTIVRPMEQAGRNRVFIPGEMLRRNQLLEILTFAVGIRNRSSQRRKVTASLESLNWSATAGSGLPPLSTLFRVSFPERLIPATPQTFSMVSIS